MGRSLFSARKWALLALLRLAPALCANARLFLILGVRLGHARVYNADARNKQQERKELCYSGID